MLYLISIPFLILITYQDFKFRAISWFFFPILLLIYLYNAHLQLSTHSILTFAIVNMAFIFLQFFAVSIYLIIKEKKLINPLKDYLGLADVLFWIVLIFVFSPFNYIIFFVGSLILTILLHFIFRKKEFYGNKSKIPLAGLQGIFLIILLVVNELYCKFNLYDDTLVLKLFNI